MGGKAHADKPVRDLGIASFVKKSEHLNISMLLDAYDDIFSSFDPRPYSERTLSEDFLSEVRHRHIKTSKGGLELRFILPGKLRNQKTESMIKRRLRTYFKEEFSLLSGKLSSRVRRGYAYIGLGALLLISVTFLSASYPENFWLGFAELLLTPPGWFGMWEGIGKVVERDESVLNQIGLSRSLSRGNFVFISEEEAFQDEGAGQKESKQQ